MLLRIAKVLLSGSWSHHLFPIKIHFLQFQLVSHLILLFQLALQLLVLLLTFMPLEIWFR